VQSYDSGDWVGVSVVGVFVGVSVGWPVGFVVGVLVGLFVGASDGVLVGVAVSTVGLYEGYSVGIGAIVCIHDILKLHEYLSLVLLQAQP